MATKHENLVKKCLLVMAEYGYVPIQVKVGVFRALYSEAIVNLTCNEGVSDIVAMSPCGMFWAVEAKVGSDTLKKSQADFLRVVNSRGGVGLVVRDTVETLEAELVKWKRSGI